MMQADYIEQTSSKKLPVIFGEKVVLVPFLDLFDLDDFIRLHQQDRRGYMCRFCLKDLNQYDAETYVNDLIESSNLYIWNVILKGVENTRVGFIYLSDMTEHSVSISGIMDTVQLKKLTKEQRRYYKTMTDDATLALIKTCFENGIERIEGDALEEDKEALKLHKRLGFVKEGLLRKAVNIDGQLKNLVVVSLLKEEFKNGER